MAAINLDNTIDDSINTVIIRPGQRVILPQDAVIQSLVLDGSIDVVSSCNNLPAPTDYKCGYFVVPLDSDNESDHAMNEEHTYLQSVRVANNTYLIGLKLIASGDNPGIMETSTTFNSRVPDQAIFTFKQLRRNTLSKRQDIFIYFKTPETLFDSVELQIITRGIIQYYKPLVSTCDLYEFGDEAEQEFPLI